MMITKDDIEGVSNFIDLVESTLEGCMASSTATTRRDAAVTLLEVMVTAGYGLIAPDRVSENRNA
jgi:hypothetical protein